MTSLVEFLEARLAEDEAVARAASPGPWRSRDQGVPEYHMYGDFGWYVVGPSGSPEVEETEQGKADVDHIARHDPARVLREVEAKRAVVAEHSNGDPCDHAYDTSVQDWLCDTLRHLASVYSDHPDYREEWGA